MALGIGTPVWTTSTANTGPTFNASRTFNAGDRVSVFIGCRDTSVADPTVGFDGVDTFGKVDDYPVGSNIAREFVYEGVISVGGTGNIEVVFPATLALGNVIIGTSVISGAAAGSGWRDAPAEDGRTNTGTLSLAIASESNDQVFGWALQRGSGSTLVADGSTTEVGSQASTGSGGVHLVAALWRRNGASPTAAIGGTWNSSNGGCIIGHNVNLSVVTGTGGATFTLTATGTGTTGSSGISGSGGATFTLTATGTGTFQGVRRRPQSSQLLEDAVRLARQRRLRLADLATESPIRSGGTAGGVVGAGGATFSLTAAGTGTVAGPPVTGSGGATFTLTATGTGTTSAGAVSGSGGATFTLTATGTGTFVPPAVSGAGGATFTLTATGDGTTTVGAITGAGGATFTLRATGTGAVVAFGAGQLHLTAKVRIRARFSGPPILDTESSA